jgi:hypothetical protein
MGSRDTLASRKEKIDCILCKKPLLRYDSAFNHLRIDESHAVDICSDCIDKFLKWQQGTFARLFPTSAMKRRYGGS